MAASDDAAARDDATSETSTDTTSNSWRERLAGRDCKPIDETLSALAVQCVLGKVRQVEFLLKRGGDINARDADNDRTPLMWAAAHGHMRVIKRLLLSNADPHLTDISGRTAAQIARKFGFVGIAVLLEEGPPLDDPKRVFEGLDGLSLASALNQPARLKALLSQAGNDPNKRDVDGDRTALHWAAARGSMKCLQLLLEAGAAADATDASGRTPGALARSLRQGDAYWRLTGYTS